ncbi:MAG: 2-C-methyl-D-erythritol 2,4-cyclodiphosphate synthase [Bacteroidales bacterium]|nr:2-C-methyl-D-erythritol 2,4-cyclodiphosphate synthase [Bacteroidales bacterium]
MKFNYRVGFGFDLHRLEKGRPLWLGGILVSSDKGCVAHSDGDVLIHATCDALLGALALGDIGMYFPDTDIANKGKESSFFLREILKILRQKEAEIINIDATIILENPSLKNYKSEIAKNLAELLDIPMNSISIKAKTHEKIGDLGKGNAIAAYVIVLVSTKIN